MLIVSIHGGDWEDFIRSTPDHHTRHLLATDELADPTRYLIKVPEIVQHAHNRPDHWSMSFNVDHDGHHVIIRIRTFEHSKLGNIYRIKARKVKRK